MFLFYLFLVLYLPISDNREVCVPYLVLTNQKLLPLVMEKMIWKCCDLQERVFVWHKVPNQQREQQAVMFQNGLMMKVQLLKN